MQCDVSSVQCAVCDVQCAVRCEGGSLRDWRPITGIDLHSRTSARVGHDPGGEEEKDEDERLIMIQLWFETIIFKTAS